MKLVNILLSIYNPEMVYLEKQLKSLDTQDYANIEIIIWDDNPNSTFDNSILNQWITNHRFNYIKCEENLGYAKAFEHLVKIASGEYVAFCDQDDIWMKDKISKCVDALEKEKGVLVTADRAVINENDEIVIQSMRKERATIANNWNTGEKISAKAVFNTLAIGMNIVMRASVAKKLLPFPDLYAHDHWVVAGASVLGKTIYLEDVLVQYRRHKNNVSGFLNDVATKEDYYSKRVDLSYKQAMIFLQRFPEINKEEKYKIDEFAKARKKKNIREIYKYRYLAPGIAKCELMLCFIPDAVFQRVLRIFKKKQRWI